jgi:hypothetical protein
VRDVFIDAPLVLISQIQRSGGSLLAQLFDGHPQVCAHPHELSIWHPEKPDWPVLDLTGDPAAWFKQLRDPKWPKLARKGFTKPGDNPFARKERHPFTFSKDEQRRLFFDLVRSRPIRRQRDILDCWFTSFFRSWREWEPTGREVAITGFMPRVAMTLKSLARFRSDYPDGKLISIVRDPRSWYASHSRHGTRRQAVESSVGEWTESTRAVAALVAADQRATLGVIFDDLVLEPEPTMRRIASFAGIDFEPCLLEPSYAGRPVLPNSSFAVSQYGINAAMARRTDAIGDAAAAYIAKEALPLYEELVELIGRPRVERAAVAQAQSF